MNPELQRNFYLEFSYSRLIGMPIFLAVIFALTYLSNDNQFNDVTANIAMSLYVFIVLFWGARQAAESIADELRNHTWDIQKTSAISPWTLTWGKLFGSTLFNWYGGFLCLFVYLLSTSKPEFIFIIIAYALSSGLLAHSLSLLVSLFALRKKQAFNSSIGYLFVLFMLFFSLGLLNWAEDSVLKTIRWYSFEMNTQTFGLLSLLLACVWSIVGVSRLLAQELQVRTLPWVWLLFIVFLVVYIQGLFFQDPTWHQIIIKSSANIPFSPPIALTAFSICTFFAYCLIFIDDNNPMQMRRLWIYAKEENWERFLEEIPCWLINVIISVPLSIYLTLFCLTESAEKLHLYPIPIVLLMVRDIAIILFVNYAKNSKRAFSLSLVYLTFLYAIIPAIFLQMNFTLMAGVFLPLFTNNLAVSIIFSGLQAAVVGYLLFIRWQKTVNQLS